MPQNTGNFPSIHVCSGDTSGSAIVPACSPDLFSFLKRIATAYSHHSKQLKNVWNHYSKLGVGDDQVRPLKRDQRENASL